MKAPANPFLVTGYHSPGYFCNREKETEKILEAIQNQRNTTLVSLRRMGKTGLIKHVFYNLAGKTEFSTHYMDLLPTSGLQGFVQEFGNAVLKTIEGKTKNWIKKIGQIFKTIRPVIKVDSLTGQPSFSFDFRNHEEMVYTLEEIFSFLKNVDKRVVIAMDEFQQIRKYPDPNVEALLRKHIQTMGNVNFIFSGSLKNILLSMFGEYSKPFYQSTDILYLDKIDNDLYNPFIRQKFEMAKKKISPDETDYILTLTQTHTFYVQYLSNRLYSRGPNIIKKDIIDEVWYEILHEREGMFFNYRNLLTEFQFQLLKSIAKEIRVKQPYVKEFMQKYNLGTPSTVATALKALLDKELITEENGAYFVQDVFLASWLDNTFPDW